ncbi:MAG: branched-chain amino acid transaminase [Maricaulaceae bacterium]|jgi:branched-chain amino acid aminotransferase
MRDDGATSYIWMNGALTPSHEAKISVLSHALHYGTAVFEGIRVYETNNGPRGFRIHDHVQRLVTSAKIYGMEIGRTVDELEAACREVVGANGLTSTYLRPIAFYGDCGLKVTPPDHAVVDVAIAALPWGGYLGDEAVTQGVDVCVSSWRRPAPSTTPAAAKAAGNYLSGVLIGREAQSNGFAEGIALGADGRLSEGAGENLFMVKDGKLLTPPAGDSILFGITRDTVMRLAEDLGIQVIEQSMPREMLYLVDEIFLTGTAAEITPVRSVDRTQVGEGKAGPVTRALQERFFGLFDGKTPDTRSWLMPMAEGATAKVAAGA